MKKTLKPVRHRDVYTRSVEAVLQDYFKETLFKPVLDLLKQADLKTNATETALSAALKSGRIWYADGEFSGEYNAAIAKELRQMGATLNKKRATFTIAAKDLPADIRSAAEMSIDRSRALHQRLQETLSTIQANVMIAETGIKVEAAVSKIVSDLTTQFNTTISGIEEISIDFEFTPELAKALQAPLTTNLNLAVKTFTDDQIVQLRKLVQQNAFAGHRTTDLVSIIENQFGVTRKKAAFLADQETGMLVAKFREYRAKEVGSRSYRWSTSHDERVRSDHRALDGQIFSWDSPPITNKATGDRNHPGEDFRCRCVALPIIEIPE